LGSACGPLSPEVQPTRIDASLKGGNRTICQSSSWSLLRGINTPALFLGR
jgi:hypothetical protein